jgi:hypothetical protein
MSENDAFQTLKTYFETRPAARTTLACLREGVEIGVVIGGQVEVTLFQEAGEPRIEKRVAVSPDVIFHITPETVYILSNENSDDIGEIAIAVIKEVLSGDIRIQVPGNWMNLVRNGYLEMLQKGGTRLSGFLAMHGLANVSKILAKIRALKSQS